MAKDANTQVIVMDHPFKNGTGDLVEKVTVNRATVKQMVMARNAGGTEADIEVRLVSIITGLIPEDLELMDVFCDYAKIQRAMQDMGKPRETKK